MRGKQGSVMIFLRGLPPHLTQPALRTFIRRQLRAAGRTLPVLGGTICHCEILRITDRAIGRVEHHGLVEIRPAKLALQAIAILNDQEIDGCRIKAHRYRQRSNWEPRDHTCPPRTSDRRRDNLKIELAPSPNAAAFMPDWLRGGSSTDRLDADPDIRNHHKPMPSSR